MATLTKTLVDSHMCMFEKEGGRGRERELKNTNSAGNVPNSMLYS